MIENILALVSILGYKWFDDNRQYQINLRCRECFGF